MCHLGVLAQTRTNKNLSFVTIVHMETLQLLIIPHAQVHLA